MDEPTQEIRSVITNSGKQDMLQLLITAGLVAFSIYAASFIAAKGWKAAGGKFE